MTSPSSPDKDSNSISSMRALAVRFHSYEVMCLRQLTDLPLQVRNKRCMSGYPHALDDSLPHFPAFLADGGALSGLSVLSLPRSTYLHLSLLTAYWRDLAADQSITIVMNSDADCFPLMRSGEGP